MNSGKNSLYIKLFLLLFALVLIGVYTVTFPTKYNDPDVNQPATDQDKKSITGILRETGLSSEEKDKLNLKYGKYEVTSVSSSTLDLPSSNPNTAGVFLESKNVKSDMIGKCVTAKGDVDKDWISLKENTVNGSYTYGNVAFNVSDLSEVSFDKCSKSFTKLDLTKYAGMEKITFKGVVDHMTRPAPDIAYDYEIKLDSKYTDPFSARGGPADVTSYILVPQDFNTWKALETSLGKHVELEGYTVWGFAETRHFEVVAVSVK